MRSQVSACQYKSLVCLLGFSWTLTLAKQYPQVWTVVFSAMRVCPRCWKETSGSSSSLCSSKLRLKSSSTRGNYDESYKPENGTNSLPYRYGAFLALCLLYSVEVICDWSFVGSFHILLHSFASQGSTYTRRCGHLCLSAASSKLQAASSQSTKYISSVSREQEKSQIKCNHVPTSMCVDKVAPFGKEIRYVLSKSPSQLQEWLANSKNDSKNSHNGKPHHFTNLHSVSHFLLEYQNPLVLSLTRKASKQQAGPARPCASCFVTILWRVPEVKRNDYIGMWVALNECDSNWVCRFLPLPFAASNCSIGAQM